MQSPAPPKNNQGHDPSTAIRSADRNNSASDRDESIRIAGMRTIIRIHAAFETAHRARDSFEVELAMTRKNERQERLAKEREDIAARIAKFKATQDRFIRERQEYAAAAWQKASPKNSMS
jgi:hypothetical protein